MFSAGRAATVASLSLLVLAFCVVDQASAVSLPVFQRTPEFKQLVPRHNEEWVTDIKCYNLPYGLVGFVNHLATYYSVTVLHHGRKPLWPLDKLDPEPSDLRAWFNRSLSLVQGTVTTTLAIYNLTQCNKRWPLNLVFIWKVIFTAMAAIWSYNAQHRARKPIHSANGQKKADPAKVAIATLYVLSTFVGFVGICGVMRGAGYETTQKIITAAFAGPWPVAAAIVFCVTRGNIPSSLLVAALYLFIAIPVLFALYSDWIIATLIDDVYGLPQSPQSALYWIYFVFKRLPLLTT